MKVKIILNGELKSFTFSFLLQLCDWQSNDNLLWISSSNTLSHEYSFSQCSQGFLCSSPAHNEHNFTPQRPIRDMTATCRPALPERPRSASGPPFQNHCLSSFIWFSTSSGLWIALPWGLFIPSETKLLITTWNNKALCSEIKTTTWQEQVQLSFLLHSGQFLVSLCWFTDYFIHNWQWHMLIKVRNDLKCNITDFVLWPLDLYM